MQREDFLMPSRRAILPGLGCPSMPRWTGGANTVQQLIAIEFLRTRERSNAPGLTGKAIAPATMPLRVQSVRRCRRRDSHKVQIWNIAFGDGRAASVSGRPLRDKLSAQAVHTRLLQLATKGVSQSSSQESFFLFTMPSGKSAYFACLGDRR
jgi:hypothetical protein